MKELKFSLIGAGKVGSAFAYELSARAIVPLFIVDRQFQNKTRIRKSFKSTEFLSEITQHCIDGSDFILISVQDWEIIPLLELWRKMKLNFNGKILMHTSGLLASDVFKILKVKSTDCGSIHPVQTFNRISSRDEKLLTGIYFGLEGGRKFLNFASKIIKILRSKFVVIRKQDKILYHTSCSIASNFLVTDLDIAGRLMSKCIHADGLKVLLPIVFQTLENIDRDGTGKALTGPIARGDVTLVKKQLKEIQSRFPEMSNFFNEMVLQTALLAERSHKITRDELQKFKLLVR